MSGSTATGERSGGGLSLEELVALNDEIVALVRAGLPLERGLMGAGGDLRGRLGAISKALAERLGRGEGLEKALEAEGQSIPPVYRAVVESGVRSGNLTAALERLAEYARNYIELRRALGLALLYPLMVLMLAYVLFLGFILVLAPRFYGAFEDFRLPPNPMLKAFAHIADTAVYWGPVVPLLLVILAFSWWRSGRSGAFPGGTASQALAWIPWMRRMLVQSRAASCAEMLGLLVEHGTPFPEAIELACESSGDRRLIQSGRALAESLRRGEALGGPGNERALDRFPPLLRWLMLTGYHEGRLPSALRHAAETYRRRAMYQADMARIFLPTILLLVIGATVTTFYVLTLFVPLTTMLRKLSEV